jgi:hypothetical protein
VHVHERFRSPPGDQTNDDVPNQMKHDVFSFEVGIDRQDIRRIRRKAMRISNCGLSGRYNPTPRQSEAATAASSRTVLRRTSSIPLPSFSIVPNCGMRTG